MRSPFTVRGQATMEQLVQFLFKFYQAGHFQQIRHLSIKPLENAKGQENSKTLKLSISIEALSLPGATRPDKLSSEPGKVLAAPSLEQYVKVIVGRNLFSPYTPSGQAPRPVDSNPPQFDLAKYAYLTASVIDVRGRPQVWLKSRAENDKTLHAFARRRVHHRPRSRQGDAHRSSLCRGGNRRRALPIGPGKQLARQHAAEELKRSAFSGRRSAFSGQRSAVGRRKPT